MILRFQRAMLTELLLTFVGILFVVTGVIFAGSTIRLVYRGQGAGIGLVIDLLPSLLPVSLSFGIPFAWLASVALVMGRMVADQEVIALRAAGVHLRTLVIPVLALGALLSLATMGFNGYGVPHAQKSLREAVHRYLPIFLSSLRDVDRTVTLERGRFSFSEFDRGVFRDVEMDRRDGIGRLDTKIIARAATIRRSTDPDSPDALEFTFEEGVFLHAAAGGGEPSIGFGSTSQAIQVGSVERVGASVLFNEFFGTRRFVERPKDMALPDLLYSLERGGVFLGSVGRIGVALHGRLALGFAPFVFGLFALGMALVLPATGRRVRDFLFSFTPPLLIYFPLFLVGPTLGRSGTLPAWLAMWSADIVVAALGVVLLLWAFRK